MAKRNGTSGVETLLENVDERKPISITGGSSKGGVNPSLTPGSKYPPPPHGSCPTKPDCPPNVREDMLPPATSNARWLAASIELLKKRFAQAEADGLWGRVGIFIAFKAGEAASVSHEGVGQVRLTGQNF
jgi:hypothetical protein